MRTVADVIAGLHPPWLLPLPTPAPPALGCGCVGLAVASMAHHMTDEGWQLFQGLEAAGYKLVGRGLPRDEVDVPRVLKHLDPAVIFIQDQREWDPTPRDFRDRSARFFGQAALRDCRRLVVTVLKDAHQKPAYHRAAAAEMGVHVHAIYYDERIVRHLAPWLGPVVRTWHSLDAALVPPFGAYRRPCLLSGAVSPAYPLRKRLFQEPGRGWDVLRHPGYHRDGCATPGYLRALAQHRVAVCTTSVYGYALRKLMEATACGCRVLTDLPVDAPVPGIDDNFTRVRSDAPPGVVHDVVRALVDTWDEERQRHFAAEAARCYDYRAVGARLAADVEAVWTKKDA